MPEGDTVRKLADALAARLAGQAPARVEVRGEAVPGLEGRRVVAVFARGKHLFIEIEGETLLRSHLGMYGSWHHYAPGEAWRRPARQASLTLRMEREVLVCFNAREVECLRTAGLRHRDLAGRLGPDLLDAGVEPAAVAGRARALLPGDTVLADVLLHQGVACGIGNVYKSELLFLGGQHPLARLAAVPDGALAALYAQAQSLLRRNLGGGPRRTRFEPDAAGSLWVYGRAGRPCLRCGQPIARDRLGESRRPTFWCRACQPPA